MIAVLQYDALVIIVSGNTSVDVYINKLSGQDL